MELEKIQDFVSTKYYNNLLKITKKMKINNNLIKSKIDLLNEKKENTSSDSEVIQSEVTYSDDYIYKKPWTKLPQIHKIITMKKYVNKLLIENNKEKNNLINKLKNLIKNKVLTKKDTVNYDKIKGRIISIPCLSYKAGKYNINI